MNHLLAVAVFMGMGLMAAKGDESLSPKLSGKFGKVIRLTVEFVEKPNTYYAQNLVKAKWFAKVKAVDGKASAEPIVMEYRSADKGFKLGSTLTLVAYEDVESSGFNREWDGVVRQFNYRVSHFLRVRRLTVADQLDSAKK